MLHPSILHPPGLSAERQLYLFEHIRTFCDEKYHDVTCPEPRGNKHLPSRDTERKLSVFVLTANNPVTTKQEKDRFHVQKSKS